jgi:16S rRNA (guanine527-N7)-methyltransferase
MSVAPPDPVLPEVEPLGAAGFQALFGATGSQIADLERYGRLLSEGNAVMNLVGPASLPDFWRRHVLDSAQLFSVIPYANRWADLGSGAGLPGIVLACLLKGRANARVYLVESMAKRCRFLTQVVDALELPAEVIHARAEVVDRQVEVVTARACAPMVKLLGFAQPWMRHGATGLFLKGQDVVSELTEATRYWKFESDLHPSQSDARGRMVKIRDLKPQRKVIP